ncbi:hypothetical protein GCM10023063_35150 [Arthrobacter methylotrophus]|uniref:Uncharacterized protein n=1 Tax=Arthrobacter methylotrophus TaxID=121291 RepID=A0ABV5UK18_9MICC
MENSQTPNSQTPNSQTPEAQQLEFHVSYLNTLSGRIEHEEFGDRSAAERFANAQLKEAEAWAVVDVVVLPAAQQQHEHAQQLVA